jgi:hypothetical protein
VAISNGYAAKKNPVISSGISIYNKRLYEFLLDCPPDQLNGGLTIVKDHNPHEGDQFWWTHQNRPARPYRITDAERSLNKRRAERFGWK